MAKRSPFKTKWPRHIMISGVKIKIKYTCKTLIDEGAELFGCFVADTLTIHISKNSNVHETLCHEIFHAWLHVSGYNQSMTAKFEEGLTTSFEHAMSRYLVF